ncbi:MAG: ATP-binding protein [Defluviitaleaceae bacterium]|nr:ATP-binding protein [Defluviitaleaceae bacterium]
MSDNILLEENAALKEEIKLLQLENKKLARNARVSKSFLDRVTRAAEAKDILSNALSAANIKQKAYTEILIENCPNIITLLDEDGRFVLTTRSLLITMNIPNFDFIKGHKYDTVLDKFISGAAMETLKRTIDSLSTKDDAATDTLDFWADFSQSGTPRYYSVELRVVLGIGGLSKGTLLVMIDLTDFLQEKQRAEKANNAKSDFLAMVSHEIRTPMNAILGMATALDRLNIDPAHQKYIRDIRRASDFLLAIINDILDFSKIEAGKLELITTNYSLISLIDTLHSMFTLISKQKNLRFTLKKAENFPQFAHGDENRVRQILTNLLSNAFKYTHEGSIEFNIWLDEQSNMRFDITDSGIGIRDEDLVKLFTPFEQLDVRKNRNIVGTGLGLAICYDLCRLMNGKILVDSEYGKGTTFSVVLPYVVANDTDITTDNTLVEFIAPKAKILVVDDMEINLSVAEVMLEIFEITPDLAESGQQAIELASKTEYDIIFMDHMMPEMDGIETTEHIRSINDWYITSPIVALTANVIKGSEEMFLTSRMDDVVSKPIEFSALSICLRKWLSPQLIKILHYKGGS